MIIRAFRQDGCRIYYKNDNNQWIEFANIAACNAPLAGFDNLTDEEYSGIVKTISTHMQDLVQDYLDNVSLIETGAKTVANVVGGFLETTEFGEAIGITISVIVEAIVDIGSALVAASYDPNQIQDAECRLFYLLQRNGYSYKTLTDWVTYIHDTYPDKFLNPWIWFYADTIATVNEQGWNDWALIGKLSPVPDMVVSCTNNPLPVVCTLQASFGGSVTQVSGKWRLVSSSTPRADGKYYSRFGLTFNYNNRECRILSVTDNNVGSGQTYAVYVVDADNSFVLVNDINSIVGYCFNELHIESSAQYSMDIETEPCSELQAANDAFLFLNDSTQPIRQAIPASLLDYGDNGIIFNLSSALTTPDANGWHHYYLENADDCFMIQEVPITFPGETPVNYGIQAAEIKLWDCNGIEQLFAANTLRTTPQCFSRIAFRTTSGNPSYLYRVSITPADDCLPEEWCYKWDFTDSTVLTGGWTPVVNGDMHTVHTTGDGFKGSGSEADRTSIYRDLGAMTELTQFVVEYVQTAEPSVNWFLFDYLNIPLETQQQGQYYQTPSFTPVTLANGNKQATFNLSGTKRKIQYHIQKLGSSATPNFIIKRATLRGTGTNPFGSDNC